MTPQDSSGNLAPCRIDVGGGGQASMPDLLPLHGKKKEPFASQLFDLTVHTKYDMFRHAI